ncbi:MAG: efflux transporter outer membrane subunit [Sphingobium sp.]
MVRTPLPLATSLAALALTGCTVGPDYHRPEATASSQWIEQETPGTLETAWWNRFDDPLLTKLVEGAIAESPTAREAIARVMEARAGEAAVRGSALPAVQASGEAVRTRLSENGELPLKSLQSIPGFQREFSLFDAGFDASWELDLWGQKRREKEAAHARVQAAEAGEREAKLMLAGEIARAYIEMRQAQAAETDARTVAEADAQIARLTALLAHAGEAAPMESERAAATAGQSRDRLVQAETLAKSAAYRVAALAGRPPEELIAELTAPAPIPSAPDAIVTGLRSDLLRRRPDVAVAERQLAAATADIGVAKGDLFPHFSLIGGIGQQARNAGDLTSGDSTRFVIGPTFSWPVFAGGRVRAGIRAANARAQAAAARYDQATITALADSESAINRFLKARERAETTGTALNDEQAAFTRTQALATRGEIDRLMLEQARKALVQARNIDTAARAEQALAAAALFKALGGGLPSSS